MKKHCLIILLLIVSLAVSAQLDNCKEILSIQIENVKTISKVKTKGKTAEMVAFSGRANSKYFKGEVMPGAFDNAKKDATGATLSARYILKGTDAEGKKCKIFIENNAIQGSKYSVPKVFTDSKSLAFLNNADLVGYLDHSKGKFFVRIYVRETQAQTKKVWVQGSKGRLAAIIEKPVLKPGEKCPMVIICHGFGGQKEGGVTGDAATQLPEQGIATIRFDFNGHGESDGDMADMTILNEIEDAKCIYRYIVTLPYADLNRIGILGHSQGGVVTGMTAGELDKRISAVVLMCPAAVLRDDAIRGNTMGKHYNPLNPPEKVQLAGGKCIGKEFIKTAFTLPIYETSARYHGSACVIHGTGDVIAPYTYGLRYVDIWPGSEYHQLDGYDHGFGPNPQKAVDIAIDYLKRVLLNAR